MKIIFKNFKLKILALASAVIFWVFVIIVQNSFYQFPEKITIQPFNLAPEFSVMNDLGDVELTLNANAEIAKTLSIKDFTAYVDLQGMGVGKSTADILVTSKNSNATVLKIKPDQVEVEIEEIAEKNVPIKYSLKGEPKEGYEISGVKLSREEVNIKGAKTKVNEVSEAIVVFSLNGEESGSITKNGLLKVIDADNEEVSNIVIENASIEADIKIKQVTYSKTVGIEPRFIGELSKGWIEKVTIKPQTIIVQGDPQILSGIDAVETEKIDLRSISGTSTIKASLKLPENITTKDNIDSIVITLEIKQ